MGQPCRPPQRGVRTIELALPAVGASQRVCLLAAVRIRGEDRERPQPLSLARPRLEPPRQRRERTAGRPAGDVFRQEEAGDLLPERARLPRAPFVGGTLPDEMEALRRPRAGGVEEVPVAGDDVSTPQAGAETPAFVVAQERRGGRAGRGPPPLEAEDEHALEPASSW